MVSSVRSGNWERSVDCGGMCVCVCVLRGRGGGCKDWYRDVQRSRQQVWCFGEEGGTRLKARGGVVFGEREGEKKMSGGGRQEEPGEGRSAGGWVVGIRQAD